MRAELLDVIDRSRLWRPSCETVESPGMSRPDFRAVDAFDGVARSSDRPISTRHTNGAGHTAGINLDRQRVTPIGSAGTLDAGLPHDGFRPLHRFVRWVNDQD
jgi:hypothetical protein